MNLRLGYQNLPEQGSGYRAALGLQYHKATDASLQDTYFQLAYHYRVSNWLYGIGVVAHSGAEVEDNDSDVDFEFDSSTGLFVYLENLGGGKLGGWGLSLTSLEIESDDVDGDVDASSAELYYSWNF